MDLVVRTRVKPVAKDSQGVVLVFDVTSRRSFSGLETWLQEATRHANGNSLQFVVAGNKVESGPRQVPEQTAREWAKGKGFPYFEVSVAQSKNVEALFDELARCVL